MIEGAKTTRSQTPKLKSFRRKLDNRAVTNQIKFAYSIERSSGCPTARSTSNS